MNKQYSKSAEVPLLEQNPKQQYKQVKVHVPYDIALSFKQACATQNTSMAHIISQFMEDFLSGNRPVLKSSPDYSTRRKRRKAIDSIVQQLVQIKAFEERYRDNIPQNLQNSSVYESAEEYIACLDEAIEQLIPF